jgi:hypothetical protein
MWTTLGIIIGGILCLLVVIPFMQGFVAEFFKMRREARQPRLRIFDEE